MFVFCRGLNYQISNFLSLNLQKHNINDDIEQIRYSIIVLNL